jgi:hypothetical protein
VAVAAVVVVVAAVVGGAVVVGALVVVGRGAVVAGAVVAGRVAGGAVAAEVGAAVGAGAWAGRVVLVVVGWRTVLSGVPTLLPAAAATAAVVEAGHGRPSQVPGGAGLPNAWRARTTTIPTVATVVATHGRLNGTEKAEPPTSSRGPSSRTGAAESATSGCRGPGGGM